jgi:hypothetical protein
LVKITVQYGEDKWTARLLSDESWSVRKFDIYGNPLVSYYVAEDEFRSELAKVITDAINEH